MNIDYCNLQRTLKNGGYYLGGIDGLFGEQSRKARDAMLAEIGACLSSEWSQSRRMIALEQWVMKQADIEVGNIDGYPGPQTDCAIEQWQNHLRENDPCDADIKHQSKQWPRQKELAKFYGKPGTGHTMLELPYPMRLAWAKDKKIGRVTIHEKCAASAKRALNAVFNHYGYEQLRALNLDLFGGCYNNRKMRGGSRLSTHAYACAFDINPSNNGLRWGRDRAAMARSDCAAFLDAFEAEGWVSLGRERNFDWMHVQAARL